MPWAPLEFVETRTTEVAEALNALDYQVHDGGPLLHPDSTNLDAALKHTLRGAGHSRALVIHLIGHGQVGQGSGALYLVGRDGGPKSDGGVDVEAWLRRVEDAGSGPPVLLLLDLCHAGIVVEAQWQARVRPGRRRAWVLGAADADQQAYQGRFSQAVAEVLRALAGGRLDVDASVEFVPLSTLARWIDQELVTLCRGRGLPQRLTVTPAEVGREPTLPFFRNPSFDPAVAAWLTSTNDVALRGFVDDADTVLDPRHYLSRALGQPGQTDLQGACFFTGRAQELETLSWWLDGQREQEIVLRVVTGSPGVGKSALLGVLVCASHPDLQQAARAVRERLNEDQLPGLNQRLGAVHARGRQLGELVDSLVNQFHLDPNDADQLEGWTPARLVEVLTAQSRSQIPTIILDALDEAVHPLELLEQLLLPLAKARNDGRPVCRVLVGTRPWPEFTPLLTAAASCNALLDLDAIPHERVASDLASYVRQLLARSSTYGTPELREVRANIAAVVAAALAPNGSGGSDQQPTGAFLVAGLYTHQLIARSQPLTATDLDRVGDEVPRTLGELLELNLTQLPPDAWRRPLLAALSHAKGAGMPARLLCATSAAFSHPASGRLEHERLLHVLDSIRFFLRFGADSDGTTLYRLFHQALADHLRQHPTTEGATVTTSADSGRVLDALLDTLRPTRDRTIRWDLAEPYLQRHAIQHATDADRADERVSPKGVENQTA